MDTENEIAVEIGNAKTANMVMLGAYLALTHSVTEDAIIGALEKTLGKTKAHLIEINKIALERGMQAIK